MAPQLRFCPACGAASRPVAKGVPSTCASTSHAPSRESPPTTGPSPAPTPAAGSLLPSGIFEPPLALSLYFPHLLVAGHSSTVRLRLRNRTASPLRNVEVSLASRGLHGPAISRVRRLEAGQTSELLLEIEPARAGHCVLQAAVGADGTPRLRKWSGSRTLLIHQAPDPHIQIRIGDIQSNLGANAGLGADYGNVQLSNLLGGANLTTLNDLLALELPEAFAPLALAPDDETCVPTASPDAAPRRRPLCVPGAFVGVVQRGSRCVLRSTTNEDFELRLIARSRFRLGRSRTDADFVTWFWPRDPAHDQRTRRLSKVQAELRADADGLFIYDAASANGTLCDGERLGHNDEAAVRLGRQAQLRLGGDYTLDLLHLGADADGPPRISPEERWLGTPAAPPSRNGCIRFTPRDTAPAPHSAVWLFTEATFGSGSANAWALPAAGLAEIQGRLHFYRDCFWLENAEANGRVTVDGYPLARGELVPLVTGSKVRLGRSAWETRIDA